MRGAANHENSQNLLQVAQFLTIFQDYFRGDDEPLKRSIAMRDVKEAIEYQELLEERISLNYQLSKSNSGNGNGNCSKDEDEGNKDHLEDVVSRIQDATEDTKLIHRILKRFEVWTTKDLSEQMFMMRPSRNDADGGSPLLNLPSAAAMNLTLHSRAVPAFPRSRRWKTRTDPSKTLLLPPNRWTWNEYLRLSYMVSLLPTEEVRCKAHQSTLTATSGVLAPQKTRKEDLKAAEGVLLSQSDLVALWVRAQRSTSAWRHLTQLFRIEKVTRRQESVRVAAAGRSGKTLVNEDSGVVIEDYVAHYVGNHSKLPGMVKNDVYHMDALVEWAVTNQVLFTHKHMVEGMMTGTIPSKTLKISAVHYELPELVLTNAVPQPPPSAEQSVDETQQDGGATVGADAEMESKKRQLEEVVEGGAPPKKFRTQGRSEEDELRLRIAKQGFILRWFARRNRKVTSVLFNTSHVDFPIYEMLVYGMTGEKVPDKVKQIMEGTYRSTDRTLARIDRRMSKYLERQSFQEAVLNLLEALKQATESLSDDIITAAMDDFRQLYNAFLGDAPRKELIQSDDIDGAIEQLGSIQAPWVTNCGVCDKAYKDQTPAIVCANCEKLMHKSCCDGTTEATKSLQEFAKGFAPLANVFSIRIPLSRPAPDFRNMPDLEWTRLEVMVPIKVGSDLRLGIQTTEASKNALNKLLSERCDASKLQDPVLKSCQPMAVEYSGFIVTEILNNSPARAAGIEEGDIVTQYRKKKGSEPIDLGELSTSERIKLVKENKGPPVLIIQRPNKPLLDMSKAWTRDLQRKANKTGKRIFEAKTIQTFCKSCVALAPPMGKRNAIEEAKVCLAVIRRLSMESYSIPFHQDGHCEGCENDSKFASLRRLDQMMLAIIDSKAISGAGYGWPFSVPPGSNEGGSHTVATRKRLNWLPDQIMNKPYELLCRGMKIILTAPIALCEGGAFKDQYASERSALGLHFLSLFSSWCLRTSFDVGCIATVGPPTDYRLITEPWLGESCKLCMLSMTSRVVSSAPGCCTRRACVAISKRRAGEGKEKSQTNKRVGEDSVLAPIDLGIPRGVETPPQEKCDRYNSLASLVGSVLLILPGDPILDATAHFLSQPWIKEVDRATPFIVASYLPSYFADLSPGSCLRPDMPGDSEETDGIFHLLPVIYKRQLNYLERIACMRSSPGTSSANITKGWVNLEILKLDGVLSLTPRQLLGRRTRTTSILDAMSRTVAQHASCSTTEELALTKNPPESLIAMEVPEISTSDSDTADCVTDLFHETATRLTSVSTSDRKADVTVYSLETTAEVQDCDLDWVSKYSALIDSAVTSFSTRTKEIIEASNKHQCESGTNEDEDTDVEDPDIVETLETSQCIENFSEIPPSAVGLTASEITNLTMAVDDAEVGRPDEFATSKILPHAMQVAPVEQISNLPEEALDNLSVVRYEVQRSRVSVTADLPAPRPEHQAVYDLTIADDRDAPDFLTEQDLFKAGPMGSFLTKAESAVVAATLQQGLHVLARRLLCPRYSWSQADTQVRTIQFMDTAVIPKIQEAFMTSLLRVDFQRSQRECGPVIAREKDYEYRMATEMLPIDVLFGKFLKNVQRELESQLHTSPPHPEHHLQHQRLQHPQHPHSPPQQHLHHHTQYHPQRNQIYPQHHAQQSQSPPQPLQRSDLRYARHSSMQSAQHFASPMTRAGDASAPHAQVPTQLAHNNSFSPRNDASPREAQPAGGVFVDASNISTSQDLGDASKHCAATDLTNDEEKERDKTYPGGIWSAHYNFPKVPPNCQRIRGGGPSEYCPRQLDELSANDWGGQVVTAKVETLKGGKRVKADIIGFISEQSKGVDDDGALTVDVIYFSNLGQVDAKLQQLVPLASLFIVEEGSEEDGIAKDWLAQHTSTIPVDLPTNQTTSQVTASPDRRIHPEEANIYNAGRKLANRFSRAMGSPPLGCLPDGRKVFWMSCDPSFVQLRSPSEPNVTFRAAQASTASDTFCKDIRARHPPTFGDEVFLPHGAICCFWGCRSGTGSFLSFRESDALVEHIEASHTYSATKGNLLQVASGAQIISLASAIVTVLCSRWPPLLELADNSEVPSPSDEQIQFDLQRILTATKSNAKRSLAAILKGYAGDKRQLQNLINLWSRLARLFDLNKTGEPRINPSDIQTTLPPQSYVVVEKEDPTEQSTDYCFDGIVVSEQLLHFTQCQLCCSDSEAFVKKLEGDAVGLGCSLIGSLGRISCATSVYQGDSASLSMSKSLLVHTATNMPQALRHKDKGGTGSTRGSNGTLWDDGSFQEWCKFVECSTSSRMIAQAFVVLLASLQRTKLPVWWRSAKAGWSKSFVVMTEPTTSGLLLQIYALDAAIASFIQQSGVSREDGNAVSDPVPKRLRVLSTEERMKTIVEWATELNVPEVEDSHGINCIACQDGGELLLCTYCETVQHASCCDPSIGDTTSISKWVCDSCIKDISEHKESLMVT